VTKLQEHDAMICRSLETCDLREVGDCAAERTITLSKCAT